MLWVKAFHIIFMVTWFAGLFYLPRLYVYHANADDSIGQERFKVMERKLFWGITTPSGIITIVLGIWLTNMMGLQILSTTWFQIKLTIVLFLIIYHIWCGKLLLDFKNNTNKHSHTWYRVFNEVPVFALIAIILLVELQPDL
jgi:putative membrane protein